MTAGVYVTELSFTDGGPLELQDNSIVVFVGPNNSGKSLTLKEINGLLSGKLEGGLIVSSLKTQKVGRIDDVKRALEPFQNKSKHDDAGYYYDQYRTLDTKEVEKIWNHPADSIDRLSNFFVSHVTTRTRLADCDPVEHFQATTRRGMSHPFHHLFQDYNLEIDVSELFRSAFGQDLVLHRAGSEKIHMYVGTRPIIERDEKIWDRSYIRKLEALEPLEDQGDGFKSFASLLIRVWTGQHSILLLDEPEAFLHPPQARLVGEMISRGGEIEKQIFISTHSNDVIQGLIGTYPERIAVVRLQRNEKGTSATYLPSEQISRLWRDPILRYSNVLNGLFHSQVIVAEADGDCRFYEAVSECNPDRVDTFYTYAGGKDRIPVLVRALRALNVPVRVVVDFDIFASDKTLQHIVEANGAEWEEFRSDVMTLKQKISEKKFRLAGAPFKAAIGKLLKAVDDNSVVPRDTLADLRKIMRQATPWDAVKDAGISSIPKGETTQLLKTLMEKLIKEGIFVVPAGEMEGFCRTLNTHGPRWVEEVLQKDLCSDSELEDARNFVKLLTNPHDGVMRRLNSPSPNVQKRLGTGYLHYTNAVVETAKNNGLIAFIFIVLSVFGAMFLCLLIYHNVKNMLS